MCIRSYSAGLAQFLECESSDDPIGDYIIQIFAADSYADFENYLLSQNFVTGVSGHLATMKGKHRNVAMTLIADDAEPDLLTLICIPFVDRSRPIAKMSMSMDTLKEKHERLGDLTSLVIHDLRNALQPVMGGVEIFESTVKDGQLSELSHNLLSQISRATLNMNSILAGLSQYMRLEIGDYPSELTDLNSLVDAVLQNVSLSASRSVSITRTTEMPQIVCQKPLIKQVFENLIDNAIKYTVGDTVQIEIGAGAKTEQLFTFFVKDHGVGISEADRGRVFRPFQRADHSQLNKTGAGMGMALVKKIVERHGGDIWFEPRVNQGTTFWFSLSGHQ